MNLSIHGKHQENMRQPRAGEYIVVGALTGDITINEPTNAPDQPGVPRDMVLELVQDATGGRTVTLDAAFRSNYSDTGNTADTRNIGRFTWDGALWVGVWSGWF